MINRKGLGGKRSWPNRANILAFSWRGWWNKPLFQPGFESDTSWTQVYSVNTTPTCWVHTMSTVVTFVSEDRNGLDDISRTGLKVEHNRMHKFGSFEQRHRRLLSTASMWLLHGAKARPKNQSLFFFALRNTFISEDHKRDHTAR